MNIFKAKKNFEWQEQEASILSFSFREWMRTNWRKTADHNNKYILGVFLSHRERYLFLWGQSRPLAAARVTREICLYLVLEDSSYRRFRTWSGQFWFTRCIWPYLSTVLTLLTDPHSIILYLLRKLKVTNTNSLKLQ